MSGLALLAKQTGAHVTASDRNDSAYLQNLAAQGIQTWVGEIPERIDTHAEVFYSSAVKSDNRERAVCEERGQRTESRHSLITRITREYFTLAIAGSHGKTTTSAWVTLLLENAGLDPNALIGGTVPLWKSNFRKGNGTFENKPLLVIEADESDKSFLAIDADVALVTNIDLDHTDIHPNLESLRKDFIAFTAHAKSSGGFFIVSKECGAALVSLLGDTEKALWDSVSVSVNKHALQFEGTEFPVGLPGRHNLMNASVVLQLGVRLKISHGVIADTLKNFAGVDRRMQVLAHFETLGLDVVDDYAHHPHEVAATLSALKDRYERLLIFWEPHRLSRFEHFHADFLNVLLPYSESHRLYSLPLYASGDKEANYPNAKKYFEKFITPPFVSVASADDFSKTLDAWRGAKTAAVFMGAGKSSAFAHEYVLWLKSLS